MALNRSARALRGSGWGDSARIASETADDAAQDHQEEEHEDEGEVEQAGGWNDAPNGGQHRLGQLVEHQADRRHRGSGTDGEPRQHGATRHDDHVHGEERAEEEHRAQAWYKPRAWSRSFSSGDTSTLLGVRRKTCSATRDMEPPTAYASPLEKSMSRRWSSRVTPCRLRITGWFALRRSPTSWASLKPWGSTTCTLADDVGIARTTDDRCGEISAASSRATGRTVTPCGCPWSRGSRGTRGSRSSLTSRGSRISRVFGRSRGSRPAESLSPPSPYS